MSLWTPSGEHPVGDEGRTQGGARPSRGSGTPPPPASGSSGAAAPGGSGAAAPGSSGDGGFGEEPAGGESMDELRRQLADAPAEVVVANHCYGLFELAAVYLSQTPPRLDQAQLAIDALGHLIEGLGPRLGEAHGALRDALAQIRLAYVQLGAAGEPATTRSGADGQS